MIANGTITIYDDEKVATGTTVAGTIRPWNPDAGFHGVPLVDPHEEPTHALHCNPSDDSSLLFGYYVKDEFDDRYYRIVGQIESRLKPRMRCYLLVLDSWSA